MRQLGGGAMRLLLVRHGESASNRRDFARMVHMAREGLTQEESEAWAREQKGESEPTGDTFLTENGHMQVEAFAEYWAPILQKSAAAGKLHVFCSPMRRNLQTAAPLLRALAASGSPVTATVRYENFEVPGMIHPDDNDTMAELMRLQMVGPSPPPLHPLAPHPTAGHQRQQPLTPLLPLRAGGQAGRADQDGQGPQVDAGGAVRERDPRRVPSRAAGAERSLPRRPGRRLVLSSLAAALVAISISPGA